MNETNHAAGETPPDAAAAGGLDALAAAEARATENRNSYLRAVAELENFRKRSEREVENARKFAIERFAQELVTVGDALEAGIAAGPASSGTALQEGGRYQDHRSFGPTLRSGVARGHHGPGKPRAAGEHRVVGHSKRVFTERPLAAPGPGHRQQGRG